MIKICARISSGPDAGKELLPHRQNGTYIASPTRFEVDYIQVHTLAELAALIRQGYSARLKAPDSKNAASLIKPESISITDGEDDQPSLADLLPNISDEVDLDPESITKRRKEQEFIRVLLLDRRSHANCTICSKSYPKNLLVAAHIKQRAKCTRSEKLDYLNVAALMCKLGCDALFESGNIFVEAGKVASASKRKTTPDTEMAISSLLGNSVSNWHSSRLYYEWH